MDCVVCNKDLLHKGHLSSFPCGHVSHRVCNQKQMPDKCSICSEESTSRNMGMDYIPIEDLSLNRTDWSKSLENYQETSQHLCKYWWIFLISTIIGVTLLVAGFLVWFLEDDAVAS